MYQAIVLLPLIGAVIAGAIALVGAHARHPGGGVPLPHGGAGEVPAVRHDSHEQEPPAMGSLVAELITCSLLVLTVAAAEAAIGLAILVVYFRNRKSIAVEDINLMKG